MMTKYVLSLLVLGWVIVERNFNMLCTCSVVSSTWMQTLELI